MIINIHSGLSNSKNHLLDALDVFCKNGYTVTTYITQAVNDAYEYLIKNKTKYEIVCVFGGDGTLNEVVNGLMTYKERPMIGYFPSGTMNDFGSNFNLSTDFKTIAENICKDEYHEFDVGDFNGRYFNYVAAFGAMCDVPYTTSRKTKQLLGPLAYVLQGMSKLNELKPTKVKVTIDGKVREKKVLFGMIFSGGRVAGQQLVSKARSKIDDGTFNVLLVDYVDHDFLIVPDIISTLAQSSKYIHTYKAKEITLEFEEDVLWTIDGEKAESRKVINIKNINKAMKIKA